MSKEKDDKNKSQDYNVLTADTASSLSSLVNEAISNGFEPVGGVAIASASEAQEDPDVEIWAQGVQRARR